MNNSINNDIFVHNRINILDHYEMYVVLSLVLVVFLIFCGIYGIISFIYDNLIDS